MLVDIGRDRRLSLRRIGRMIMRQENGVRVYIGIHGSTKLRELEFSLRPTSLFIFWPSLSGEHVCNKKRSIW